MALTTKQKYGLGITAVVVVILIIFGKRILSALGLSDSDDTATGIRRSASVTGISSSDVARLRLSPQERIILNKYATDLSNLGIRSEGDVRANLSQVQMIVSNMNKSLMNIGSKIKVYTNDSSVVSKEKKVTCNEMCLGRGCTGNWHSWIFGFCICFGCEKE